MSKFRKKPVVIEAYCLMGNKEIPDWLHEALHNGTVGVEDGGVMEIHTLEGTMRAEPTDWIIRGVKGEIYACKPDIFAATYTPEAAFAGDAGQSPDWRSGVPWEALRECVAGAANAYAAPGQSAEVSWRWLEDNATKAAHA